VCTAQYYSGGLLGGLLFGLLGDVLSLVVVVHTVALWTFTFHKISGFVRVIFEGQFQTSLQARIMIFFI
jgi:hypothetical protein